MPNPSIPLWKTKLTTAFHQDPKKTGILGVLVIILLVVAGRLIITQSHPALAAGSLIPQGAAESQIIVPAPLFKPTGTAASLREWISTPVPPIKRNIFLVKSEYFPQDTTGNGPRADAPVSPSPLEKSLSLQADQKEHRDAMIASLKVEAAQLRPTAIVMDSSPRAMVNGTLVSEGDSVGVFRVLRIEPLGIVVEHDGIRLAIPMGVNPEITR